MGINRGFFLVGELTNFLMIFCLLINLTVIGFSSKTSEILRMKGKITLIHSYCTILTYFLVSLGYNST